MNSSTTSDNAVLSVIMPAYNEEGSIREAVHEVQAMVLDKVPGAEIVIVDDGSADGTGSILDEIAGHDSRVRVIHQENGGHAAALMAGISGSSGDFIMLLDSDRQIALDDFNGHWVLLDEGYDCVMGVRRKRHDPRLRLWLTHVIRYTLQLLFGVKIYDANIPYKILRRSVWDEASKLIPPDTLAPSLFLAIYMHKRRFRIHEADVVHRERATGEVSIRRLKLLKFCLKGFGQMLRFRSRLLHAQ